MAQSQFENSANQQAIQAGRNDRGTGEALAALPRGSHCRLISSTQLRPGVLCPGRFLGECRMAKPLMTISILEFEGANGADMPVAVINWDELEDGNIEALLSSKTFLDCVGVNLKNESGADEETALLAAARSFFSWREATEEERRGWQSAYDEMLREEGEPPPFFLWDPRLLAH
jgi:hypothetical protein